VLGRVIIVATLCLQLFQRLLNVLK